MNLDLDEIAGLNEKLLGIDTKTESGKQEIRELAFVEDALSEEDAIESMYYPYGRARSLSDSPSLNTNFAIIDINKKQFNRYKNFYGKSLYQLEQETSLSPATQYR